MKLLIPIAIFLVVMIAAAIASPIQKWQRTRAQRDEVKAERRALAFEEGLELEAE